MRALCVRVRVRVRVWMEGGCGRGREGWEGWGEEEGHQRRLPLEGEMPRKG